LITVQDLYNHYSVDHWFELEPWDPHYVNFDPNLIYAAHKIGDVYFAFSSGRSYLSDFDCDNFGQLIAEHNDLHLKYIRSKFIQSALSYYNYAIDLSWQVVWFYLGDNSYLFMENQDYYGKYSGLCTNPNLLELVKMRNREDFRLHVNAFNSNPLSGEVRQLYNYVKHRGSLYTKDLGRQYNRMMMGYRQGDEEFTPSMITRKEFDLNEWKEKLIQFDQLFYYYFEQLIYLIIPQNYQNVEYSFEAFLNHCSRRLDFRNNVMADYERRFNENFAG
jgi:hypothetical protein